MAFKLYFAGGEGLPRSRQKQMFTDGVRSRLVSFFTGVGPCNKVVQCARDWEKGQNAADTNQGCNDTTVPSQ